MRNTFSTAGGIDGDYRMIRNPEKEGPSCIFTGTKPTYDDSQFVCAPVKKGLIHTVHIYVHIYNLIFVKYNFI